MRSWNKAGEAEVEVMGEQVEAWKKRSLRTLLKILRALSFPRSLGKKSTCSADVGVRVQSLGWEDPLEKKWQPTPVFLPGKSCEQSSLAVYSL